MNHEEIDKIGKVLQAQIFDAYPQLREVAEHYRGSYVENLRANLPDLMALIMCLDLHRRIEALESKTE